MQVLVAVAGNFGVWYPKMLGFTDKLSIDLVICCSKLLNYLMRAHVSPFVWCQLWGKFHAFFGQIHVA
jgi:hypothetical protein